MLSRKAQISIQNYTCHGQGVYEFKLFCCLVWIILFLCDTSKLAFSYKLQLQHIMDEHCSVFGNQNNMLIKSIVWRAGDLAQPLNVLDALKEPTFSS